MKCTVCGRQIQNHEANFCEYCGSSFREHKPVINNDVREQYNQGTVRQMPPMNSEWRVGPQSNTEAEKPITFLNWLSFYGLIFIPYVGWMIFLVMLIIWAFSSNTPTTKKNWARASLIFILVVAVLGLMLVTFLISIPMFRDMMNGDFDQFYKSLYENTK